MTQRRGAWHCKYCGGTVQHDRRACRMKRRHADPEFAAAHRERMKRLHADPEFAAANRERLKRLNADPEFAAAHRERSRERLKRLHADPEFAAAHRERNRERMKRRHADPARNPLVLLTEAERRDYDTLKRAGFSRDEALASVGRHDLVSSSEAAE